MVFAHYKTMNFGIVFWSESIMMHRSKLILQYRFTFSSNLKVVLHPKPLDALKTLWSQLLYSLILAWVAYLRAFAWYKFQIATTYKMSTTTFKVFQNAYKQYSCSLLLQLPNLYLLQLIMKTLLLFTNLQ